MHGMCRKQSGLHDSQLLVMNKMLLLVNKSTCNNKITELRTIFQRESQNSYVYKQTKSVNNRKTVKTVMTLTNYDVTNYDGWLTIDLSSV